MQECSVCSAQSPDEASHCIQCNADLSEFSTTAVALKNFIKNPRVDYVRIEVSVDCCPACRELAGSYPKDKVPKLPAEDCSHNQGCRCFYQPFLNELFP